MIDRLLIAVTCLLVACGTHAETVFLNLVQPGGSITAPVAIDPGFTLTPGSGVPEFSRTNRLPTTCDFICGFTHVVALDAAGESFSLSRPDSNVFDLVSFEGTLYLTDPNASALVRFAGTTAGGSVVQQDYVIPAGLFDNDFAYTRFDSGLDSFRRLTNLEVTMITPASSGAAANIGTIEVQVVPLPAALWMLISGLGCLGWRARRRA